MDAAPATVLKVPAGHSEHVMPPPYVPAGQSEQVPVPACVLNLPAEHAKQADKKLLYNKYAPAMHSHPVVFKLICEYVEHVLQTCNVSSPALMRVMTSIISRSVNKASTA